MKKYIIAATLDGSISKLELGSDGKIGSKNKPTFKIFTKIENVIDANSAYLAGVIPYNMVGYIFEYNGEKYWTYYRWLLAEDTEENIELMKVLEELRSQQKSLQKEMESVFDKIKLFE